MKNTAVDIHVTIDINVVLDNLCFVEAPRNLAELLAAFPLLARILDKGCHLVDSDHILDLIEAKAISELDYTPEQAKLLADLIQEASEKSQGVYVSKERGENAAARVTPKLNPRFVGRGRGQVDHEDQQVLGAAFDVLEGVPGSELSIVVTRDRGILNVKQDVANSSIVVKTTEEATELIGGISS